MERHTIARGQRRGRIAGEHVLASVANEGEPGASDPMGSVSIIDFHKWPRHLSVDTADLTSFDGTMLDPGIVIAAGKAPSVDLEPEYITVSHDSKRAWLTIQDANAVAEIDVDGGEVTSLRGLGFKDHRAAGNALDASDRDNSINLCTWPGLHGMYQPDAIACFHHHGQTYLVTANEGDYGPPTRRGSRRSDHARPRLQPHRQAEPEPRALDREPDARDDGRCLQQSLRLRRPVDLDLVEWRRPGVRLRRPAGADRRVVPGRSGAGSTARPATAGPGGPQRRVRALLRPRRSRRSPRRSPPTTRKGARSTLGATTRARAGGRRARQLHGRTDTFVGLERVSGVVAYEVTDPEAPAFKTYVNPRDFNQPVSIAGAPNPAAGTSGRKGLTFIPAWQSLTFPAAPRGFQRGQRDDDGTRCASPRFPQIRAGHRGAPRRADAERLRRSPDRCETSRTTSS